MGDVHLLDSDNQLTYFKDMYTIVEDSYTKGAHDRQIVSNHGTNGEMSF